MTPGCRLGGGYRVEAVAKAEPDGYTLGLVTGGYAFQARFTATCGFSLSTV
jgi:hypothetical protein